MTTRTIELPGVFNFRDIGGYRAAGGRTVRWRRLFRSGDLHRLTEDGVRSFRDEIAVRTVIDLRWPDDHERAGTLGLLANAGIKHHHVPFGDAERLGDIPSLPVGLAYLPLAERCGDDVVRAVRVLAGEGALPAVIHCSAGKDRTGILTALLLSLLGVDDETIIADYMLTEPEMPRWIAYLIERGELPPEPDDAKPHPGDAVAPVAIQTMLDTLRATHGSIEGYFRIHGLGAADLERLREVLLE